MAAPAPADDDFVTKLPSRASRWDQLELLMNNNHYTYAQQKALFEVHHSYISSLDKYMVDDEIVNISTMKLRYKKRFPNDFFKLWMQDATKRQCVSINIYPPPLPVPANVFNLWQPSPCAATFRYHHDAAGLRGILRLFDILAPRQARWLQLWIAQLVQLPHDTTYTFCPIFVQYDRCDAKNKLLDLVDALFGHKATFNGELKHFGSKGFTSTAQALLVNLRSFQASDTTKSIKYIQRLRAAPSDLLVRPMYVPPYYVKRYHRYFITDDFTVQPPHTKDPFFKYMHTSTPSPDDPYWGHISRLLRKPDALKTTWEYFNHMSLEPLLNGQLWTRHLHPYFDQANIITLLLCLQRHHIAHDVALHILSFKMSEMMPA